MTGPGAAALNVSRETYALLVRYAELLTKWNPRINLVSKSSLEQLWVRHMADWQGLVKMAIGEQSGGAAKV